ncbi:hypothetical protein BD779DRAFT_1527443 [Infundibulicybe gibba]|nr:hypothetical protein BD779DRAFT_1527443 [Infundibulicybe gibba]
MAPQYAFLSRPPPPQKKRPTAPLPPLPCQSPHIRSAIASWAAHVQPGSPGSPHSPCRRPSLTRSTRRPSISRSTHARGSSGSFLLVETPTSAKDFDLTTLGYTSVFVHVPKTPATPAMFVQCTSATPAPPMPPTPGSAPASETQAAPKRFRSLAILRGNKPKSKPATPKPKPVKPKKRAYPLPPPLHTTLLLNQLIDGGSMDATIHSTLAAHPSAAATNGVAGVHRDAGAVWWDREEQEEYMALLGDAEPEQWVQFPSLSPTIMRSASTQTSTLSPTYLLLPLQPADSSEPLPSVYPVSAFGLGPLPGFPTSPLSPRSPAASARPPLLTLPSRPQRSAKHLRQQPSYMLDLSAFVPPPSPPPPSPSVRAPRTPRTTRASKPYASTGAQRQRSKSRRRPAPLTLPPTAGAMDIDVTLEKSAFLAESFSPAPPAPAPTPKSATVSSPGEVCTDIKRGIHHRGLLHKMSWGALRVRCN